MIQTKGQLKCLLEVSKKRSRSRKAVNPTSILLCDVSETEAVMSSVEI